MKLGTSTDYMHRHCYCGSDLDIVDIIDQWQTRSCSS